MGWNPVNEAKKWFKKIENLGKEVEGAGREAVGKVEGAGKSVVGKVESAGKSAVGTVERTGRDAVGQVERAATKAGREIEATAAEIPKVAKQAAKEAVEALTKAVTPRALAAIRDGARVAKDEMEKVRVLHGDLVDYVDALGFDLELGPTTLRYENFYTRADNLIEVLDRYVNHPPSVSRKAILQMIEALGPTSVDLGLSVNFALGVGSKQLGVGFQMPEIHMDLFQHLGDKVLEAIGVPE